MKKSLLRLESLPPRTVKGTIIRLLEQVGQLDRNAIGVIELQGRRATVEVPADHLPRLVRTLDGTSIGDQHIRASSASSASALGHQEPDHFRRMQRLLDLEGRAETEQTLSRLRRVSGPEAEMSGESLIGLVIRDEQDGLGGRTLLTLSKKDLTRELPWSRLSVGTPVLLSDQSSASDAWRGVVSERTAWTIEVALDQATDSMDSSSLFRLDLSADEVARQRQRAALERARLARGERLAELRDILLGQSEPAYRPETPFEPLDPFLNPSQSDAIRFALSARDLAVLHGPPGTGKTTAVVELIRQAIRRDSKVLACAPSNLAVDNLLERLLNAGEKAVRIGHPARVLPELREHTLDLIVERHPDVKLANRLVREASTLRDRAARYTRAKPAPGAKREMHAEAKRLLDDARRLEKQVVQHVLDTATVICATTTAIDSEVLGQRTFDWLVIDEACQSTEPGCWIPLARCERLVLAGDHCQLPPTVVSREAQREGLGASLQERLMEACGPRISRRLTVQYRMHEQIMEFPSAEFYEASLIAADSVRGHRLCDLPGVASSEMTETPLRFIDTAGSGYDEQIEPDGESRFNAGEGEMVCGQVRQLLECGVSAADIAVITPYAAQVRHLREALSSQGVDVDTVDGFQGREREAVVISLVRSNREFEIGFLADTRRMNVAITRARRKLIVIGDSATVASHPFYRQLLEYFEQQGAYRTVWEFMGQ
jgi:superfamily I DNA and/or RNA helicase